MKLWYFSESPKIHGNVHLAVILQEISVQNSCRQMQTVLDLNFVQCPFLAYFEKLPFLEKSILTKMAYGLGQDISCINFLVVSDV